MKKIILMAAFAVFGFTQVNAQFKVGAFFGLPMADASDTHSFNVGIDAAYLFDIVDSFQVGPATGYSHSFGKEIDSPFGGLPGGNSILKASDDKYDDFQFIPIAAAARFNLDALYFGADLGYAIGLNDGNDGGVYYRPKVGYNFGPVAAFLSYTGISMAKKKETIMGMEVETGGGTFGSLNVGAEFSF